MPTGVAWYISRESFSFLKKKMHMMTVVKKVSPSGFLPVVHIGKKKATETKNKSVIRKTNALR